MVYCGLVGSARLSSSPYLAMRKTGIYLNCILCNSPFYAPKCLIKRGKKYCSQSCYYEAKLGKPILHLKTVQFKKGHIPYNKTDTERACGICKKEFHIAPNKINRGWGKYCSAKCRVKSMKGFVPCHKGLRGYNAGEKSPNWQGGITSENTKLRRSFEYKNWVFSVFKRDNFTCQHCHKKTEISGRLVADHVLPFSVFP